jgi:hypothetical protein
MITASVPKVLAIRALTPPLLAVIGISEFQGWFGMPRSIDLVPWRDSNVAQRESNRSKDEE